MSVHLTRQDEFAVITLDRQEALNALSAAVLRELAQAFDAVAGSDARALIVTGAGAKAFCAGADIKELTGRSLTGQRRDAAFPCPHNELAFQSLARGGHGKFGHDQVVLGHVVY